MKHAAMAFLALILVVPCALLTSASPQRAAAASISAFRDGGPEPFGEPFVRDVTVTLVSGQATAESAPFTVPEGKLLIAEFATVSLNIEAGTSTGAYAVIRTTKGSEVHDYCLVLTKTGLLDLYFATQPVRFYVPAGMAMTFIVGRNYILSSNGGGLLTLSGRLINN